MDADSILYRVKVLWKHRNHSKVRSLIRCYLAERDPTAEVKISNLSKLVSTYYKPGLNDYVISPGVSHYLELMLMDINFAVMFDSGKYKKNIELPFGDY